MTASLGFFAKVDIDWNDVYRIEWLLYREALMLRIARTVFALMLAGQASGAPVCTSGAPFAGTPNYDEPMERAKDGQRLKDVPPLNWRTTAASGTKLVMTVGPELWYTDLSAADPVLKRLIGKEDPNKTSSVGGPCASARFAGARGLALLSDGSLVGSDNDANNLFVVKDPFGSGCTVIMIAGAIEPQDIVNDSSPASLGDRDGPGAQALLGLPEWVAVISDTIFFIDGDGSGASRNSGEFKLKKIDNDAARTVKTVAKLPNSIYYAMVALNGKLYTIGNNSVSEGLLLEIDPATGAIREVVRGRSNVWGGEDGRAISISGLATDGTGLFATNAGRLLYITPSGEVSHIAGSGVYFDYSGGYKPEETHNAMDLQLVSRAQNQTAGAGAFLAYTAGNVYHIARNQTTYVLKIGCK